MKNLKLYVTPEDYKIWAGGNWPSYDDFINGQRPTDPEAQLLVDQMLNYCIVEQGIKFPIKTKTSCQSKWTWSTIFLNTMSTSSCHRVNPVSISVDNFDNFHNLPEKLLDRKMMLEGKWPGNGCEYCRDIEAAGGYSDRQHNLEIPDLCPPELENNPNAINVTPRIVEIFAQNTCNFSCIYCNPSLSSKIEQENLKFGLFNKEGVVIPIHKSNNLAPEIYKKFLIWLEKNIKNLKRLHLLGGETLLQRQLMDDVLDIINQNPNKDLRLGIFSNFNVPDSIWDSYMTKIKNLYEQGNIKKFDLTASIDCWGAEAEYVRYGLDLVEFEKKFKWASEQNGSWLTLFVNQTITPLTIKTMPELIEKINQYSKNNYIAHYWEMYIGNDLFLHPSIYSYEFWEKDFDRIFSVMQDSTAEHKEAISRMKGIQMYLKNFSKNNTTEIQRLKVYLNEIDRRRGTDWHRVFPYLRS